MFMKTTATARARRFALAGAVAAAATAMTVQPVAAVAEPGSAAPSGIRASAASVAQPGAYAGYGFDACDAPSASTMTAWRAASPYRAIGVYLGGVNRACAAQPT